MTAVDRVLWVTGAGGGMGRAAAVTAAREGMRVGLSGRRREALEDTARTITATGGEALVLPVDVDDPDAVAQAHLELQATWGRSTDVVLAAGLNAPERTWADQAMPTFEQIVATNLTGVARVIDTVLPGMREQHGGHVVVISSYAGWRFSPGAGVAYSASKTALAALCQSLNAQEAASGVRACHLCPGDVDTDFLALRPNVPGAVARQTMLSADDVARAVLFVLNTPAHLRIDELVLSPLSQT